MYIQGNSLYFMPTVQHQYHTHALTVTHTIDNRATSMHTRTRTHTHTHTHTRTHTHMYTHTLDNRAYLYASLLYAHAHTHKHTHMFKILMQVASLASLAQLLSPSFAYVSNPVLGQQSCCSLIASASAAAPCAVASIRFNCCSRLCLFYQLFWKIPAYAQFSRTFFFAEFELR